MKNTSLSGSVSFFLKTGVGLAATIRFAVIYFMWGGFDIFSLYLDPNY